MRVTCLRTENSSDDVVFRIMMMQTARLYNSLCRCKHLYYAVLRNCAREILYEFTKYKVALGYKHDRVCLALKLTYFGC